MVTEPLLLEMLLVVSFLACGWAYASADCDLVAREGIDDVMLLQMGVAVPSAMRTDDSVASKRGLCEAERKTYNLDAFMSDTDADGSYSGLSSAITSQFRLVNQKNSPAFNPSLELLPAFVAVKLGFPDAKYIATLRHFDHRCGVYTPKSDEGDVHFASYVGVHNSVALLDESFCSLAQAPILMQNCSGKCIFDGDDLRLFVEDQQVLISYTSYTDQFQHDYTGIRFWVGPLDLQTEGGELVARAPKVDRKDSLCWGKNLGIFKDQKSQKMYAVVWPLPLKVAELTPDALHEFDEIHDGHILYNNANPIALPGGERMLFVGHSHTDKLDASDPDYEPLSTTTNYKHHFIVIDAKAPFEVKHVSPAFCLPASGQDDKCELVQFIVSVTLIADDELALAYGINDCEAAVATVPLKAVLDFTNQGAPP